MMAKNEFRFLNSRQLWANTQSDQAHQLMKRVRPSAPWCVNADGVCVCVCHSLCCYLDELLEELHSLTELAAQADLGDHPQLNLVEPVQKQVQIGRGSPEVLPAESVVQQLVLGRKMQENECWCWTVQLLLPHNDASLIFFSMLMFSLGGCTTSCMQLKSSQSNMVIW